MNTSLWDAIQLEYISGGSSYRDLATKHKVSFNTLQQRAKREEWTEKRKLYREQLIQQSCDKITTDLADKTLNLLSKELEGAEKIMQLINTILQDPHHFNTYIVEEKERIHTEDRIHESVQLKEQVLKKYDVKALKLVVDSLAVVERIKYSIYGLISGAEQQRLQLERERLELEKSKIEQAIASENTEVVITLADQLKEWGA